MVTNKTDKWFSIFIRLRDSDDNGYVKCVTCGKIYSWRNVDCGHYVKRNHQGARFNEKNCAGQCKYCNYVLQGNDVVFSKVIIERYGQQTHDLLKSAERGSKKRSQLELDLLAKEYHHKAIDLAEEKGLKI
jgi:Bacteriophage Lambda NinG protein